MQVYMEQLKEIIKYYMMNMNNKKRSFEKSFASYFECKINL